MKQKLLDGMMDYMQMDREPGSSCGYTQEHIDRCAATIDAYLAAVAPNARLSQDQVAQAVKGVVLDLNNLNDECAGGLIETDQREALVPLILAAAAGAGLVTDEDITEQWRKW